LANPLVVPGEHVGMALHDADTQAAAQSALGRALATFHTPNDDPSLNSYADATSSGRACSTMCCNPALCPVAVPLPCSSCCGRWIERPDNCKLLRYINLPRNDSRAGSGFDTFLIEATVSGNQPQPHQTSRCAGIRGRNSHGPAALPLLMGLITAPGHGCGNT